MLCFSALVFYSKTNRDIDNLPRNVSRIKHVDTYENLKEFLIYIGFSKEKFLILLQSSTTFNVSEKVREILTPKFRNNL